MCGLVSALAQTGTSVSVWLGWVLDRMRQWTDMVRRLATYKLSVVPPACPFTMVYIITFCMKNMARLNSTLPFSACAGA